LYLSEYFERFKDEYIQNLFQISTRADWATWVEFCLRATITQAKSTIARCEKLLEIRDDFNHRLVEVGGSVRLNQIVEQIFDSPFVRIADLPDKLGVTYPTAKADVGRLTDAGILRELPNISPKTFYAPEVYSVAYEELEEDL
jgi:Fic family protein